MNSHFYRVWLPLQIATVISFAAILLGYVEVNWLLVLVSWFLIGVIGMGVGYHRLFSHRQFETWRPLECVIAVLGTLSCYAPLLFWASQHQYHHSVVDEADDPSSPSQHGFWESFLWWRLRDGVVKKINLRNYCSRVILRDKFLMFVSTHFNKINLAVAVFLLACGPFWFINLWIIPVFIEHFRINLVSSCSHLKVPGSYKVFATNDQSYNHIIIGWLTMGFGWHNAHHQNARELINTHRWWELDVEGLIGKALSKK